MTQNRIAKIQYLNIKKIRESYDASPVPKVLINKVFVSAKVFVLSLSNSN